MLIISHSFGIRSERRLCEEVHLNLAYCWFYRLGLEDAVPDHSTFPKNRHGRFRDSGAFCWVFDEVVRRYISAGLVTGDRAFFAYSTNYLIDTAHGVILDVGAIPVHRTAKV